LFSAKPGVTPPGDAKVGWLHKGGPQGRHPLVWGEGWNNLSMAHAGTLEPSQDTETSLRFREGIQIIWVWVTSWGRAHRSDAQ